MLQGSRVQWAPKTKKKSCTVHFAELRWPSGGSGSVTKVCQGARKSAISTLPLQARRACPAFRLSQAPAPTLLCPFPSILCPLRSVLCSPAVLWASSLRSALSPTGLIPTRLQPACQPFAQAAAQKAKLHFILFSWQYRSSSAPHTRWKLLIAPGSLSPLLLPCRTAAHEPSTAEAELSTRNHQSLGPNARRISSEPNLQAPVRSHDSDSSSRTRSNY